MNAGFEDCTILDNMLDDMGENWSEVIPAFSGSTPANGHAIAELAQRNFIEMRDLVADPKFLLRKQITAWLARKIPVRLHACLFHGHFFQYPLPQRAAGRRCPESPV
jgi:kynurenine 3-monooxygenase